MLELVDNAAQPQPRPRQVLVVSASPRPDGNSRLMADALAQGAHEAGDVAEVVELGGVMSGLLRDCRRCRRADGCCAIEDDFAELVLGQLLPADAIVYATPLYWYGMAASLKNFFDRLVCYISGSYPRHEEVVARLMGKRSALLLASEESFATAGLGVVYQLQEVSRYLHQQFVGVVNGVGNKRGEVGYDPAGPLDAARRLGANLFEIHHSDYDIASVRPNAVWSQARRDAHDAQAGVYEDV